MRLAVACVLALACSAAACGSTEQASPEVPTQLSFATQPTGSLAAGAPLTVTVSAEDNSGKLVSSFTAPVSVALSRNPDSATLAGTTTVNATNGVATFTNLSVTKAGAGFTLLAAANGLTGASSTAFAIMAGPASQVAFTTQPSTTWWKTAIAPPIVVSVQDTFSNPATGNVTMSLPSPHGGTLSGTVSVSAVNGSATFANLSIDTAWVYKLAASVPGRPAVLSSQFTVYAYGSGTGISYNGGRVLHTAKVAAIYWGNSVIYRSGPRPGTHGAGAQDGSLVGAFLRTIGGSPYFNILTTYADKAGFVPNQLSYTEYWADSLPTPLDTAPSDAAITAEIARGFATGNLHYDPNTIYVVFSGPRVNLGGGFLSQYCGYHSYAYTNGFGSAPYAVMPYDSAYTTSTSCIMQATASPNNDPAADAEVNVLAHELAESITDPYIDAWYSYNGQLNEVGDLCAWQFGHTSAAGGAQSNESIGGRNFLLQMLWVDAGTQDTPVGCQQNWTAMSGGALVAQSVRAPLGAAAPPGSAPRGRHVFPPRVLSP